METHNLVKVFEESIKKHWQLPALSNYQGETFTYGEIGAEIKKLHLLFSASIKKGDKIALIGKSSVNWAVSYLATITYGATIVPILPDFHSDNIVNIINHSDSKLLFAGDAIIEKININELKGVKGIISLDNFTSNNSVPNAQLVCNANSLVNNFVEKYPNGISLEAFLLPEVNNNHLGVISYTSGTTGFSKGVMLPMQSLMSNIEFAWNNMPLEAEDKLLSILPLAHAYGCAFELLWPFTIGVHTTFLGKIVSPQVMVQAFADIKPRLLLMVPLIMEKLYKKRLQPTLNKLSMRILLNVPLVNRLIYKKIHATLTDVFGGNFREVVIGGAALNKDVEIFLRKIKFNFSVGYGMTECGPLVSYANWDEAKIGSCGKLVDSLEMMIDSPDPENIPGEILVRGESVMLGYYKNIEDTKKTIDELGWMHTGDLGVIGKDNFVSIRGRSKSVILGPSGENIYPEEIESKLSNMPYVQEQLVISDERKLVALVFPDIEKAEKEGVNKEELDSIMESNRAELNEGLPKYSQIAKIKIQEKEFEKTPKQSIKRFKYEQANV